MGRLRDRKDDGEVNGSLDGQPGFEGGGRRGKRNGENDGPLKEIAEAVQTAARNGLKKRDVLRLVKVSFNHMGQPDDFSNGGAGSAAIAAVAASALSKLVVWLRRALARRKAIGPSPIRVRYAGKPARAALARQGTRRMPIVVRPEMNFNLGTYADGRDHGDDTPHAVTPAEASRAARGLAQGERPGAGGRGLALPNMYGDASPQVIDVTPTPIRVGLDVPAELVRAVPTGVGDVDPNGEELFFEGDVEGNEEDGLDIIANYLRQFAGDTEVTIDEETGDFEVIEPEVGDVLAKLGVTDPTTLMTNAEGGIVDVVKSAMGFKPVQALANLKSMAQPILGTAAIMKQMAERGLIHPANAGVDMRAVLAREPRVFRDLYSVNLYPDNGESFQEKAAIATAVGTREVQFGVNLATLVTRLAQYTVAGTSMILNMGDRLVLNALKDNGSGNGVPLECFVAAAVTIAAAGSGTVLIAVPLDRLYAFEDGETNFVVGNDMVARFLASAASPPTVTFGTEEDVYEAQYHTAAITPQVMDTAAAAPQFSEAVTNGATRQYTRFPGFYGFRLSSTPLAASQRLYIVLSVAVTIHATTQAHTAYIGKLYFQFYQAEAYDMNLAQQQRDYNFATNAAKFTRQGRTYREAFIASMASFTGPPNDGRIGAAYNLANHQKSGLFQTTSVIRR